MAKAILKLILTMFIILAACSQLPQIHKATLHMLAKRSQRGFSSLEKFNRKLWNTPH